MQKGFLCLLLGAITSGPAAAQSLPVALDTTIATSADVRIRVDATSGKIEVRAWDRSAVRIVASQKAGPTVHVQGSAGVVNVWETGDKGRIPQISYAVTVPRGASLILGSGDVDISVADVHGDITAKNYAGQIAISGSRGTLNLKSTLGEVQVSDATGDITAESLDRPVRLRDVVAGSVTVTSSGSHLYLSNVRSSRITARTVGGVIEFSGPISFDGQYLFTSHDGSIALNVVNDLDATISVATVRGAFSSEFPTTIRDRSRDKVFTAVAGNGSATLELESFGGGIVIRRGRVP